MQATYETLSREIDRLDREIERKSAAGTAARNLGFEDLARGFYQQADDRIAARSALRDRLAMLEQ